MDEFDFDILEPFFDALSLNDKTDKYTDASTVNVKLGYYYAYDIINAQRAQAKKALEAEKKAREEEAKKPPDQRKPVKSATTSASSRTVAKTPKQVELPIPGSGRKFKLGMKYVIRYFDHPITMGADNNWDAASYNKKIEGATPLHLHLTVTRTLGDAVHDDAKELARSTFYWHKELANQSTSGRRDFAKNLKDISFVPTDAGDADAWMDVQDRKTGKHYIGTVGMEFKKALAEMCTYDVEGDYYGKWTAAALKAKHRSYISPNLSEQYLIRGTGEYELEQGWNYALLLSPVMQRLYRIRRNKNSNDVVELDRLVGLDESQLIPPADDPKYDSLPKPDLILFYAVHGLPHGTSGKLKRPSFKMFAIDQAKEGAWRRLADCEREVKADIGDAAAKKLRARSDFDWFVELAKLRFTDELYVVDITSQNAVAPTDDNMLQQLRKKLQVQIGQDIYQWADNPTRVAALEPTRKLLEDKNKLVLYQGLDINKQIKFVGIHGDEAYLRDVERDVTLKMPVKALVQEMVTDEFINTIYRNTEGMIYISQIIVWGGLAVIGVALIPGAIAARTIYRVVAQRVRSYAIDKAAKQILIYELPALAAGLASIIAGLFEEGGKEWKAFCQGFFKGYAVNTLKKVFMDFDAENVAKAVLREYYLYQKLKKLHHVVKQLSDKFNKLSDKINKASVRAYLDKLEKTAGAAIQGALVIFQLINFLEHSDGQDIVVGLSAALSEDPIETLHKNEYYAEAKDAVIDSVVSVSDFITGKGKAAFETVDKVFDFLEEHENIMAAAALALTARRIAKTMAELKTTKDTKSSPKKIILVVLALIGGGVVAHVVTDGKSTEFIGGLGTALKNSIPGPNPDAAELRGEIYGRALGALFFDHGLIGSKSALGRVAKHDKIAKRLRKEARHGILMPLITVLLQRYVVFYRKALGHDGKDGDVEQLFKDLAQWRTQNDDKLQVFDQFRSTKQGLDVYEVISAILHIEDFLNKEVRDRWAAKWGGKIDGYAEDLAAFRSDAQALGMEDLVKKHAPVIGYAMLMQLRVVIRNIKLAFRHMIEEVTLPNGEKLSLFGVLDMLGFDMGDLEEAVRDFDESMGKQVEGFKTK